MPKLLELFCGTKSVSKVARTKGWTVVSVDIDSRFEPDICSDILTFNYKQYKPRTFDMIWASPPCTEFSIAKTTGVRNLTLANAIVKKTRQIIDYLQPKYYCMENPVGLLRHQTYMKNLNHLRVTVSYCKYGYPYRKNTDLWTNIAFTPKACSSVTPCKYVKQNGIHPQTVQHGRLRSGTPGTKHIADRYSIPKKLLQDIFASV